MIALHEYDVVALNEEIQAIHKATSEPILLRPGQVGTILMSFDDRAYLVDFADAQGNTYAMETVPSEKLMQLVYEPLPAYAEPTNNTLQSIDLEIAIAELYRGVSLGR